MKEIILENISMINILDKYNIKRRGNQFVCPFHRDKNPSAKAYKNSYFCFACGKTGDIIQFVEDYFNIDFKSAMNLINKDFNLGLSSTIDKKQLYLIKKARIDKEQKNKQYNKKIIEICDKISILRNKYNCLKNKLNPYNWEEIEYKCSKIWQQIEELDFEFEQIDEKIRYLKE